MATLLFAPPDVHPCDIEPPPAIAELEADHSHELDAPQLPLAEWIHCQAALFRSPAKHWEYPAGETELVLDLVADVLQDLALGCKFHRCVSPRDYLAVGALAGGVKDLDLVRIPTHRASYLADYLDCEAAPFLEMGTDVGRLCASAILAAAEDAESLHARDVYDYLAKRDAREEARRDELAALMAGE